VPSRGIIGLKSRARAAWFSKAREKAERRHMAVASEPSSISRILVAPFLPPVEGGEEETASRGASNPIRARIEGQLRGRKAAGRSKTPAIISDRLAREEEINL